MSHKNKSWTSRELRDMERREAGFKDSTKNGMNMSVTGFPMYNISSLLTSPANSYLGREYARMQGQMKNDNSNNSMK